MLLLLLLPGKWLQCGKRTDYCLGILAPEIKNEVRMADEGEKIMKSAGEKYLLASGVFPLKLEPEGMKGCDEELRIAMFGWLDDSDNT